MISWKGRPWSWAREPPSGASSGSEETGELMSLVGWTAVMAAECLRGVGVTSPLLFGAQTGKLFRRIRFKYLRSYGPKISVTTVQHCSSGMKAARDHKRMQLCPTKFTNRNRCPAGIGPGHDLTVPPYIVFDTIPTLWRMS